ncbi:AraC family transcriptional regulator [Flavobacterium sp. Fl-318]|uniref:AraC family transcriptional regulator n=1 Tax=Flavobacterium cupriresistens TaxID=2893885 RepID=A0ABU4R8P5_9FLAO|nr:MULTISPECIES: AraC family transcriptional regulator [unclassified Flavobacterium]MDX6187815.1 AraC family transcriptional regulator [Flavobacterium sp. Fl-318]UFH42263.1 AraC family transcriptional regulator [Flavobacterium sp. F-323]
MKKERNQQRIRNIYDMLLEMSVGNFTYYIPRTKRDDDIEGLVVLVNMLAEEMKEAIFYAGYINPNYTYKYLMPAVFILDSQFIIKSFSPQIPDILGRSCDHIIGQSYNNLLTRESEILLVGFKEKLNSDPSYTTTLQLVYVTPQQLLVPSFCVISPLVGCDEIFVCSITTLIKESKDIHNSFSEILRENTNGSMRSAEAHLIQNVYDYIIGHLDTSLPSLRELSQIFGINEFKLKHGFRELFSTSIYQFYNEQRLKNAHLLIEQSSLPLKEIAYRSGFSTYANFSKSFKKKFDYAPNELKRLVKNSPK